MELYVLRHGTTKWNESHLLQGGSDIPLNEEGRKLAREVGEALKDTKFDLCYSSPLARAYETAKLVLGDRGLPIIKDDRIREMSFGIYEGTDVSRTSRTADPRLLKALNGQMELYPTPPQGESPQDVIARTHAFYENLRTDSQNADKRILVSTHGAAGRALMTSVWGGSFWHGCVPPNCSVCIVKLKDGQVVNVQQDVIFYHSGVVDWYR